MTKIKRRSIKIKGKSIPIELYLLNALSLNHFDDWYDEAKKKTNALVRFLVKDEINLHPRTIERYIIEGFFPADIKELLRNSPIEKETHE